MYSSNFVLMSNHLCMCLYSCYCSNGHLGVTTHLVSTGRVDVNFKNKSGETPLHKACE